MAQQADVDLGLFGARDTLTADDRRKLSSVYARGRIMPAHTDNLISTKEGETHHWAAIGDGPTTPELHPTLL